MGSNMQRQAVPLVRVEAPLVGTGMERDHRPGLRGRGPLPARGSVDYVDSQRIIIRVSGEG